MRTALIALLAVVAAAPAFAADAPVARRGEMLRDANNVRLGMVDSVKPDGSVGIIFDSRYVVLPAATLISADGKLTTKLTKADLKNIR